jgi:MFS family permease
MITQSWSPSRSAVRRVAAARLISVTGSEAAYTALLFVLYRRTASVAWVSAALLATFGTVGVLSPLAGSLGDRFDRRRVMIASDLAGAACFAALAIVRSPSALVMLAFLAAVTESPFLPASGAAIPNLASADDLAWANGTVFVGSNVGFLAGPFLGGALVAALGAGWVFRLNAASFVVSAVLVAGVRGSFSGRRDDAQEHRGLRAGFRFVMRDRDLRTLTLAFAVFVLAVGSVLVAELPLVASFHRGSLGFGLMATFWGTGALAGALGARRLTVRTERTALVAFSFVTAVGIGSIALLPSFSLILLALLVAGCSDGVVDVAAETLIQRRAPDAVRSRVSGAVDGVIHTVFAASFLFAGAVVLALGPRAAYAIAGAGCALTAVMLLPLLRSSDGRRD